MRPTVNVTLSMTYFLDSKEIWKNSLNAQHIKLCVFMEMARDCGSHTDESESLTLRLKLRFWPRHQ